MLLVGLDVKCKSEIICLLFSFDGTSYMASILFTKRIKGGEREREKKTEKYPLVWVSGGVFFSFFPQTMFPQYGF